jgi:ABC-type polysaccharide/polyol phosphate export permease
MAGLIDGYRRVLIRGLPPDPMATAVSGVAAVLAFLLCYRLFKRIERALADAI